MIFIDLCIPDEAMNDKWKVCIAFYQQAIIMLRKKDDFTDEQIGQFQSDVDIFFPNVGWIVWPWGCHQLHPHDGKWAFFQVLNLLAESIQAFAARLGSIQQFLENILLSQNKIEVVQAIVEQEESQKY